MTTGPDTTPAQLSAAGPGPEPVGYPTGPGWTPGPPLPETPARRSGPRSRLVRVGAPIAVAVVVGALRVSGVWGGADDPQVGDCVRTSNASDTSFDVVDCSSKDAQYEVVGTDPEKLTSKDFETDDSLCSSVPATTVVLWSGTDPDEGSVYCAAPVGSAG